MGAYIGIDYGTKKIGIALSDKGGEVAFPQEVVDSEAAARERIGALSDGRDVAGIVVGESLDRSGEPNRVFERARAFGTALADELGAPVFFEPEFYSTKEAEHMREEGARGPADASAAAVILQSFLDKQNSHHA